jgi:uncharacterized protein (TIGR04255 family)
MRDEREIYKSPPVALVALEVRHPRAEPLTVAQRNALKRRLAAHVPIMQVLQVQELTVVQTGGGAPGQTDLQTEKFPRLFSRDRTVAVSIRAESVVIEATRYPGWQWFRTLAGDALEARHEVCAVDGVERLGLRYVNEIRVPDDLAHDWSPWVDRTLLGPSAVGPELGMPVPQWQGVSLFAVGPDKAAALRYGPRQGFAIDPGGELRRSTPTPGPYFLLDIDSFWTPSDGVPEYDVKVLLETCDALHAPTKSLFERLISDRLREEVLQNGQ